MDWERFGGYELHMYASGGRGPEIVMSHGIESVIGLFG